MFCYPVMWPVYSLRRYEIYFYIFLSFSFPVSLYYVWQIPIFPSCCNSWYLYDMVRQNMLRTYEVKWVISKKKIGFHDFTVKTICLQQIKIPFFTLYVRTVTWATIWYTYHTAAAFPWCYILVTARKSFGRITGALMLGRIPNI